MILPTKHMRPYRSLLGLGATVLDTIGRPMTVSALWDRLRRASHPGLSYGWFILALDLLYMIGAIDFRRGLLVRAK